MGKRIMVVDDDREFLEELRETLNLSGYEVIEVNEPLLVFSEAVMKKPDLILLDIKMPKKSGFQIADELKHTHEFTRVPIIAMTGYFRDDFLPLMQICGIEKYLKKPFNPLDVIALIEEALTSNAF